MPVRVPPRPLPFLLLSVRVLVSASASHCCVAHSPTPRSCRSSFCFAVALSAPPAEFDWTVGKRLDESLTTPAATLKQGLECWLCLDLTAALLRISACGLYTQAQELFLTVMHGAPQLLLAALVQMAPAGSPLETPLQAEMLESLLPQCISSDTPSSNALLKRMWELQPAAVMRGMVQHHSAQPQSLLRLLDLAQSFGALEEILRLNCYAFTLDLAAVASRKDLIELEPWVVQALTNSSTGTSDTPDAFAAATMHYLREQLVSGGVGGGSSSRLPSLGSTGGPAVSTLTADAAAAFFRGLFSVPLPSHTTAELNGLYRQCVQAKPKLQTLFNPAALPVEGGAVPEGTAAPAEEASAVADPSDAAAVAPAAAPTAAPTAAPAAAPAAPPPTAPPAAATGMGVAALASSEGAQPPSSPLLAPPAGDTAAAASLAGVGGGSGTAGSMAALLPGMPGGQEVHFAPNIEEEANSYFQRIYTGASSIDDVIAMLKVFQSSSARREQEVYACMVHNLFDEYRYFPKYPDKPLRTTALLFGALVQHSLVSSITLGMFLRYVLEALRKPPGSKMCKFGVAALESFRARLPEWPQYCQHLYAIPHFSQVCPDLVALLETVPGVRSGAAPAPAPASAAPAAANAAANLTTTPAAAVPSAGGSAPPGLLPGGGMGGGMLGSSVGGSTTESTADLSASSHPALPFAPGLQVPSDSASTPSMPSAVLAAASAASGAPPQPSPAAAAQPAAASQPPQAAAGAAAVPQLPASVAGSGAPTLPGATAELPAASVMNAFGSQPCIDELSTAASTEVVAPPDAVQDRIGFVLNNMQTSNVAEQSATLREMIDQNAGCVSWFAQYLVVKRVSLEPNFHNLYAAMLNELSMTALQRAILSSTLQNARVLLASPKIRSSSSQRSLLKNLGSWLGQITLARNKSLLMRDIDMKELICDAYERGLLIAVVPFVAKVLDACAHSRVFLPPNPWVMGLMSLLLELYQVPDLKLNLKFEIEVLAKTLKVELADIRPANRLAGRQQDRMQTCDFANRAGVAAAVLGAGQLGSGFGSLCGGSMSTGAPAAAMGGLSSSFGSADGLDALGMRPGQPPPPPGQPGQQGFGDKSAAMMALQQQQQQLQQQQQQQQAEAEARRLAAERQQQAARDAQTSASQISPQPPPPPSVLLGSDASGEQTVIPNLSSYLHINAGLQLFVQNPQLKRVVPVAIDRAIREIIQPVVERSVTIACVTSRELMLKDFAMEPDETRMKKAAQLMAQTLAGSLALVTCKEPLRVACSSNMRSLLQQAGAETQLMEQVVQVRLPPLPPRCGAPCGLALAISITCGKPQWCPKTVNLRSPSCVCLAICVAHRSAPRRTSICAAR